MAWKRMYEATLKSIIDTNNLEEISLQIAEKYLYYFFTKTIKNITVEVQRYNKLCDDVKLFYNIGYIFHSRAFNSFIKNPFEHIKQVLAGKIVRAINRRMKVKRFNQIAKLTVKKCIDTNMRILFQNFIALSILYNLHDTDLKIVYPENSWVHLDRKGHQHGGVIPPNYIIKVNGKYFSFFIEAPRPINWSLPVKFGEPLPLHAAPRPDLMIYNGWIENIVEKSNSHQLIKPPKFILECKEVDGWWRNVRKSKGAGRIIRSKEDLDAVQVIELYYKLYKPEKVFVISKVKVPRGVKYKLSLRGADTIDNTNLNPLAIKRLTEYIINS